jgi:hypothetical protein
MSTFWRVCRLIAIGVRLIIGIAPTANKRRWRGVVQIDDDDNGYARHR